MASEVDRHALKLGSECSDLPIPQFMVHRPSMKKHDRMAVSGLFVKNLDTVSLNSRHGRPPYSLPLSTKPSNMINLVGFYQLRGGLSSDRSPTGTGLATVSTVIEWPLSTGSQWPQHDAQTVEPDG
jgi:hypothetical protein